jgi:hypothetical protein
MVRIKQRFYFNATGVIFPFARSHREKKMAASGASGRGKPAGQRGLFQRKMGSFLLWRIKK